MPTATWQSRHRCPTVWSLRSVLAEEAGIEQNLAEVDCEELLRRKKAFPGENNERVRKTWPLRFRERWWEQDAAKAKSGLRGDGR